MRKLTSTQSEYLYCMPPVRRYPSHRSICPRSSFARQTARRRLIPESASAGRQLSLPINGGRWRKSQRPLRSDARGLSQFILLTEFLYLGTRIKIIKSFYAVSSLIESDLTEKCLSDTPISIRPINICTVLEDARLNRKLFSHSPSYAYTLNSWAEFFTAPINFLCLIYATIMNE